MNKKAIISAIVLIVVIVAIVIWLFPKRQVRSDVVASATVVRVPTATVAPTIVAPAPARAIPANVTQSVQKALANRQERLQQLGETPSAAEKK